MQKRASLATRLAGSNEVIFLEVAGTYHFEILNLNRLLQSLATVENA
jgi:hypothetical protein